MGIFRLPAVKYILVLLLCIFLTSCGGFRNNIRIADLLKSNCNQQNKYDYSEKDVPIPIHEIVLDSVLLKNLSFRSLNTAYAIGVLDSIDVFLSLKIENKLNSSIENKIRLLDLYQKINQRINIASLEISAITSEIDCEEERTDQFANYLKSKEDVIASRLTVGAIITGAVGALTTGVLLNSGNVSDYVGTVFGITEASLGFFILMNTQKIDFYHKRNALREIWEGHLSSKIFPPSVWYYLNYYNPNKPEKPSLRYQIIERWMAFGQIEGVKEKQKRKVLDIYFGEGGRYTAQQLNNRANMLDQLESIISLMKQDLKALALEFENLN